MTESLGWGRQGEAVQGSGMVPSYMVAGWLGEGAGKRFSVVGGS